MSLVSIDREFDVRQLNDELVAFHGGTGETFKLSGLAVAVVDELLRRSEGATFESLVLALSEQQFEVTTIHVEHALEQLRRVGMVTVLQA